MHVQYLHLRKLYVIFSSVARAICNYECNRFVHKHLRILVGTRCEGGNSLLWGLLG